MSTCKTCGNTITDARMAYCPACTQDAVMAFGLHKGPGLRISVAGSPDRPVRKVRAESEEHT